MVAEVTFEGFDEGGSVGSGGEADVVAMTGGGDGMEHVLEAGYFGDAGTTEEAVGDGIGGEAALAEIEADAAFESHHASVGEGEGSDASLVAAEAAAGAEGVFDDGVGGDAAGALHEAGGHVAAMEQDALVRFVAVVVVPVEDGGGFTGGQAEGVHGDGVGDIDLAGGGNEFFHQVTGEHAGGDSVARLKFGPTPDGEGPEAEFGDDLIEHHAEAHEVFFGADRDTVPGGVAVQLQSFRARLGRVGSDGIEALEEVGEVEGFDGDTVFLEGDLVVADGFEGGGTGADGADPKIAHAGGDAADAVEEVHVFAEGGGLGGDGVRGGDGEGDVVLGEHVGDGEFAAEGVAPLGWAHAVEGVGVGVDEDGDAGVLQGDDGSGFVAEVGEAEDDAVESLVVFAEEAGVAFGLGDGFDTAEPGGFGVEHEDLVSECAEDLGQFLSGFGDQGGGEEAAVAEEQSEARFRRRSWGAHG